MSVHFKQNTKLRTVKKNSYFNVTTLREAKLVPRTVQCTLSNYTTN